MASSISSKPILKKEKEGAEGGKNDKLN